MSSPQCGAVKEFKNFMPNMMHAFCLNHLTNLALLDSFKISDHLSFAVEILQKINSFFSYFLNTFFRLNKIVIFLNIQQRSAKRQKILETKLTDSPYTKLKAVSLTRWSEVFTSTNRVLDCYVETTEAIKVVEMQDDKIAAGKTLKRLNDIQNPSNLMALCILNFITEKIQPLVKVLQERGISHCEGMSKMRTLKKILEKSKYDFPDVLKSIMKLRQKWIYCYSIIDNTLQEG